MAIPTAKVVGDAFIKRLWELDEEAFGVRSDFLLADYKSFGKTDVMYVLVELMQKQAEVYAAAKLVLGAPLADHANQLGKVRASYSSLTHEMARRLITLEKP